MYKKGFTEIEEMLMREHKAGGGRLGEEMEEKVEKVKKPMMHMTRLGSKKMSLPIMRNGMKKQNNMRVAKEKEVEKETLKGGGKCRTKKAAGGKNMALNKPEMLLNAKRTGFAAGAIGKVRKGEY